MNFLYKGLKYNTHAKKKDWIQTLAPEAETAITQLPTNERDVYRKLIADRIDTLQRRNPTHKTHPEVKIVKSTQRKLKEIDVIITREIRATLLWYPPTNTRPSYKTFYATTISIQVPQTQLRHSGPKSEKQ